MAADWRVWYGLALESQAAAQTLFVESHLRPCASRSYYAAYQAVTAVLLYRGLVPPLEREAWSHEETPRLFVEHGAKVIASQDKRKNMAARLSELYRIRVEADYVGSRFISQSVVRKAVRDSNFLVKIAKEAFPEG